MAHGLREGSLNRMEMEGKDSTGPKLITSRKMAEYLPFNLVDVRRGANTKQFSEDFPLHHNKQKSKMFPNNNHVSG